MKNLWQIELFGKSLAFIIILSGLVWGCNTNPPINSPTTGPTPSLLTISHYFNDDLGLKSVNEVLDLFKKKHPNIEVSCSPMDHEAYKVTIPALLEGDNPPDVFSYWAGARVQFLVDAGQLQPIDDLWTENKLDQVFPTGIATGATYNGKKYFMPIGYYYVAFFYNKKLFDTVGASPPTNWDELKTVAEQFKRAGIPAFALGSRERWPAQFWFDYLLLRTTGPEYRQALMVGQRSYTDPEVIQVMEMWKELVDAGYFYPDANAYDWSEAADVVARGQAAITLMGTWITSYYKNNLGLEPEKEYDYFAFPIVDEGIPMAALGPIDGFVMAKGSLHPQTAQQLLAFLATFESQTVWTLDQGTLLPNVNVDPTTYDPLTQRVLKDVAAAEVFAFNYDLATSPPMAEVGLNAFSEFLARPDNYMNILRKTENSRSKIFKH